MSSKKEFLIKEHQFNNENIFFHSKSSNFSLNKQYCFQSTLFDNSVFIRKYGE